MSAAFPTALARALRGFFADHLPRVRGMSPHTVLSYRDAFTLLLRFVATRRERLVVALDFHDLGVDDVLAFLDHLETDRHNSAATRNARLAAVHAFARYAAASHPEHLELCQRVLAVPFKRARARVVEYLEADEIRALLDAPDRATPDGRRDHALLLALFNTGARVQEILDVRPCDLQLARPLQVRLRGKGRKERMCPLWPQTAEILRALLAEHGIDPSATQTLFRNRRGEPLTRFGVRYLLRKYAHDERSAVTTLRAKRVHPHVLRHTTAVHLLQAGVDLVTISHWLGHASVETTNRYAAVDLETKRAAVAKARPLGEIDPALAAWRTDATILQWLEAL
ncbi:MAG: site-specific integrase [Polyangiaceae bacterium]